MRGRRGNRRFRRARALPLEQLLPASTGIWRKAIVRCSAFALSFSFSSQSLNLDWSLLLSRGSPPSVVSSPLEDAAFSSPVSSMDYSSRDAKIARVSATALHDLNVFSMLSYVSLSPSLSLFRSHHEAPF